MSTAAEGAGSACARPWLGGRRAALAAAATGGLFALAQPPAGAWPLALLTLAPLGAALAGRSARARAGLGALAGALAALAAAIGPAAIGAAGFAGRPLWQAGLLVGAVGLLFGAAGFAAFAVLAGDPRRGPAALAALRAGAAFAAGEALRAHLFGGLPWLLLAYALAPAPALLGLAAWGGVPLLSAWLGTLAIAALRGACGPDRGGAVLALAGLAALALAAAPRGALETGAPGAVTPTRPGAPAPDARRVALVQPGLPMARWADPLEAPATVAHLTALSQRAVAEAGPLSLLVWPENAVQALLPANEGLVRSALARLDGGAAHLLLGAPRHDGAAPPRRFNAALLFGANGERLAGHDKVRLLPLFERAPRGLERLAVPGADLHPGEAPRVLPAGALRLGPLLCYEVLFPDLARRQVRAGAGVLVNLSNDAWFGGSGGAEQHFAAAVVLAATLHRPVLRATPTGVTAAIDARGRVAARLPAGAPGALVVDVVPGAGATPAARLGGLSEVFAVGLAVTWTALGALRRRLREITRPA